jgi:hypothetical protein
MRVCPSKPILTHIPIPPGAAAEISAREAKMRRLWKGTKKELEKAVAQMRAEYFAALEAKG